ncbi:MAG TPA: hypothetical protein VND90_01540 [Terracidiphilus sp.]|nr:hypothetical protein [Terracidiphilus sp.]
MKLVPVLSALAVAAMVAPYAHAGCGQYRPASFNSSSQRQFGSPYLLRASFLGNDEAAAAEPTIVGTWKERWISKGSNGIPDGAEIDAGYAQWHSDGTEINVSGLRTPMTGDVCLGEWIKTGPRSYRLNHFGISYDPTGLNLVGPARIQQWLTLDQKGMTTSGTFSIDQYDEAGNLLAHIQGNVIGTRVTMDTGFQKVE